MVLFHRSILNEIIHIVVFWYAFIETFHIRSLIIMYEHSLRKSISRILIYNIVGDSFTMTFISYQPKSARKKIILIIISETIE